MLARTTDPTTTILTLAELKDHLNITHDYMNDDLNDLLEDITDTIEHDANDAFTNQVWTQYEPYFQTCIHLKRSNITGVVVKYYDSNNVLQTYSTDDYAVYGATGAPFIRFEEFPACYDRPEAVQIIMTCGINRPMAKRAAKLLAANWNENREDENINQTYKLHYGYERLINNMRKRYL